MLVNRDKLTPQNTDLFLDLPAILFL